ncbi:hypothetical protein Trydic_g8412 [Trypoxylus dichotomus]
MDMVMIPKPGQPEGQRSTVKNTTGGVSQGSTLSPLLFSIYASDIPTTAYVNLPMHTDAVCIFLRSRDARIISRRFQAPLDTLQA